MACYLYNNLVPSVCLHILCMSVCLSVCLSEGCSLIARKLMDRFSKFKRHNYRFFRLQGTHLWFWKSTSGLAREIENGLPNQVFGSYHEIYWTEFRNSNNICLNTKEVIKEKYCP